jgi:oligopeptide transport system permease protein
MVLPVLALSFGTIAELGRYVRAELTEALTSEYMLLALAKGLTRTKAITRHAMKNAMVPILPMIISLFLSILGGSMIIERIFAVNGVGSLYIRSIALLDYDVFIATSMFYTFISLASAIIVDLSTASSTQYKDGRKMNADILSLPTSCLSLRSAANIKTRDAEFEAKP